MTYTRWGRGGWVREIDRVRIYLGDENGEPNAAQAEVADLLALSLPALREAAAAYLDLFVDRRKACGREGEPWWLDEIEFREGRTDDGVSYLLHLTLDGDDGGLWTVEMRALADEQRPFRFERRQG